MTIAVRVRESRKNREFLRLLRQMPDRLNGFSFYLSYQAAVALREELLAKIPDSPDYDVYRKAIQVVSIHGLGNTEAAFAVRVNPRGKKVRTVDTKLAILYIEPRRKLARAKPEILVLQQFGPWTADTLPFMPSLRDAKIVTRTVIERKVKAIEATNRKQRPQWRLALAKCGFRKIRVTRQLKKTSQTRKMPDVVLDGLQLEFGGGKGKVKPHWRPGIRAVVHQHLPFLLKNKRTLRRFFEDVRSTFWRQWSVQSAPGISVATAKNFLGFQAKVGKVI